MKLAGKQIGVLVALVLAMVILFLPAQDSKKYRFDPRAIARSIEESEDHIDPGTISQWLIEGRRDFMLVDIRGPEAFAAGHINGAENIPLSQLLQKDTLDELPKDKLMVIYSNGVSHAAQAWLVMKTAGFDSYMLEGGFNYWNQVIMNPKAPADEAPDDEVLQYKTQLAVKGYFGGDTSSASDQAASVDKPKTKKITPKAMKKKLKGC